jgi:hypothetical protein
MNFEIIKTIAELVAVFAGIVQTLWANIRNTANSQKPSRHTILLETNLSKRIPPRESPCAYFFGIPERYGRKRPYIFVFPYFYQV